MRRVPGSFTRCVVYLTTDVLPSADTPEARTARAEAETLRRQWIRRMQMSAATDWLERQPQLGRDVFARGEPAVGRAGQGARLVGLRTGHDTGADRTQAAAAIAGGSDDVSPVEDGDLTELLRACLVALRLPPDAEIYQPRRLPFWSSSDAAGRIKRLLPALPAGAPLAAFLPEIAERGPDRELHCRAAVAATLVAGLELARDGSLTLQQDASWHSILVA